MENMLGQQRVREQTTRAEDKDFYNKYSTNNTLLSAFYTMNSHLKPICTISCLRRYNQLLKTY